MKRFPIACAVLVAALTLPLDARQEPERAYVGALVLAPDGRDWLENRVVVVGGGRILELPYADQWDAVLPVVDASGLYLVPGLIDLHTHLLLHPYDEAGWNEQVLSESLGLRTLRAAVAARATLEAGFTTIRELGTEGAGFADVAVRDAIAQGLIPGPRILCATKALAATGCYGVAGFDPRWDPPKGAQIADGELGVRLAVREQIAAGADWIKVYADYRRRPGAPSTPTYSPEELRALVAEADSAGVPVAAHASTDEGIRRSIAAGVETIEHGTGASLATLKQMRAAGAVLCPTLAASEAIARYGGWRPGAPEPERVRAGREMFARALESGVTIACGSDAGVFSHGDNAREIELMCEYGMTPSEALRAATQTAARVLGRGDSLGRTAPGYVADLVGLREDPLQDPSNLRHPALVVVAGEVAVDQGLSVEDSERNVLGLVQAGLKDLQARRFDALAQHFAPEALVFSSDLTEERAGSVESVGAFVARLRTDLAGMSGLPEWVSFASESTIHGDVACVWAPFTLTRSLADGQRMGGVDVFHLARTDGTWRIVSLTYTNRRP